MKSLAVLNECLFSEKQKDYLTNKFCDVVLYTDTKSEKQAIDRIDQRNIIIMDQFLFSFTEKLLRKCTKLELIIVNTTAFDNIDMDLLNKYGIKLVNLKDYATEDVAETALSMIFSLNSHTQTAQQIVNQGTSDIWPGHPISSQIIRKRLVNQKIGIVGLGKIGQECAKLLNALRLNIIGYNRTKISIKGVKLVSIESLFKNSDIILITLSYKQNENVMFINKKLLFLAKKDALLVSISHPDLIDLPYLIRHPNKFRGIGFDYLVTENVRRLMKIRKNNIIITPHLGSQSVEAIKNMTRDMIGIAINYQKNYNKTNI